MIKLASILEVLLLLPHYYLLFRRLKMHVAPLFQIQVSKRDLDHSNLYDSICTDFQTTTITVRGYCVMLSYA